MIKKVYAENDLRHHPFKRFFLEIWWAKGQLWTLFKRVAMATLVTWGGIKYLTKDGKSVKESLREKIAKIDQSAPVQDFKENWRQSKACVKDIRDEIRYQNSPEGKRHNAEYQKIKKQREQDMDEMFGKGEWRMKYVKPGDPEYPQAAQDVRDLMAGRMR